MKNVYCVNIFKYKIKNNHIDKVNQSLFWSNLKNRLRNIAFSNAMYFSYILDALKI